MSTELVPHEGIRIEGEKLIAFDISEQGIEITLTLGCDGWGGCGERDYYTTIKPDDWQTILSYLSGARLGKALP